MSTKSPNDRMEIVMCEKLKELRELYKETNPVKDEFNLSTEKIEKITKIQDDIRAALHDGSEFTTSEELQTAYKFFKKKHYTVPILTGLHKQLRSLLKKMRKVKKTRKAKKTRK
jgi:hypothetical protein